MCYIIGSNTTTVLALSQDETKNDFNRCDDTCLDVLSDASSVLLVIASILFSINEIHDGKLYLLIQIILKYTFLQQ